MTSWHTLPEMLGMNLPGLPTSLSGLQNWATTQDWSTQICPNGEALARKRAGRGGGMEYHSSLLPPQARASLAAEMSKISGSALVRARDPRALQPADMGEKQVLKRDARLTLLSLADAYYFQNAGLGPRTADHDFSQHYGRGTVEIPAWIKAEIGQISGYSLGRWRKLRDKGEWHAVGGKARKSAQLLDRIEDGAVATFIAAHIFAQPFLTAMHLRDLVEARFGGELRLGVGTVALPAARSFQRFIADWKARNEMSLMAATNPDKFKSHYRFSGQNAYAFVGEVNELWEIDASPADVLLNDGRYAIYACVDVYSRRMLTYVSKTARTEATLALMRKAILAWGVPQTVRTDNGSDFISQSFVRALNSLGIRQERTDAFSPEQKGIVERAIGTLQRGLMPTLPGFIGHDVADRKMIEGRKAFAARLGEKPEKAFCVALDLTEFKMICDRWTNDKYAHAVHSGIGVTPFARAQSSPGTIRTILNLRGLDLLLSPVAGDGWRNVTKQGVRLDAGYYISGALMKGMRVFCRQDPEDMGRILCFDGEAGSFIAEAICPTRMGADPRQAVAMVRAEQKQIVADANRDARALAKTIKPRDMIDAVLDMAGRKSAAIVAFPTRKEAYANDAIEQAGMAMDGVPATPNDTPALMPPPSNVVALPETAKVRFARALAIQDAAAAGFEPSFEDARWLGGYENSAEYKTHAYLVGEHGREWLNA